MKKVAVVLHGLGPNGIDSLFANLSKHWNFDEFDITYFLAVDPTNKQFYEDLVKNSGVKIVHISDLDGNKIFEWPFRLFSSLRKYGPFDVIHLNMDMLNGINVFVAKLAKIPNRICHAHNSANNMSDNGLKSIIKHIYISVMRKLINILSTQRIGCSKLAAEYFFKNYDYKVIYNGINLNKFYFDENKIYNTETPKLITVGRVVEQKNPLFIVDIMGEVLKIKPNATLLWLGNGDLSNEVREKIIENNLLENIKMLGNKNNVEDYLKIADCFLLPSLYEGLALVLLEAQASNLTCFVSNTISNEVDCGGCLFLSLEESAEYWAKSICNYLDSENYQKIDKSKLEKFDIDMIAKQFMDVYRK